MKRHRALQTIQSTAFSIVLHGTALCLAQERPTILAGHGTLSASILPLWVGVDAKLFEKHGLQVKPIYLPRAAGRPALLSGDIQVLFFRRPAVGADAFGRRRCGGSVVCGAQADIEDHGHSRHSENCRSAR